MDSIGIKFKLILSKVIGLFLLIWWLRLNLNHVPCKEQSRENNEVDEVDFDQSFIWHCKIDGLDNFPNPVYAVNYEKSIE